MAPARLFNYRKILPFILGGGISLLAGSAGTYEPGRVTRGKIEYNTHSLLTKATVELWNGQNPGKLLDLEEVVTGTINEDSEEEGFIRAFNHFCDFQSREGILGFLCSKDWAQNPEVQSGKVPLDNFLTYGPGELRIGEALAGKMHEHYQKKAGPFQGKYQFGDQSWPKAVAEKDQRALGHILHLIQDLTVPAHSRNDVHPDFNLKEFHADSYEVWAGSKAQEKIELLSSIAAPKSYFSLDDIFNEANEFAGRNFFSDDTIKKYSSPDVKNLTERREGCSFGPLSGYCTYYFGAVEGKEMPLLRKGWIFKYVKDNRVLQEYWKILGRKAVEMGLAIIDLYFREIEKEQPPPPDAPAAECGQRNGSCWPCILQYCSEEVNTCSTDSQCCDWLWCIGDYNVPGCDDLLTNERSLDLSEKIRDCIGESCSPAVCP